MDSIMERLSRSGIATKAVRLHWTEAVQWDYPVLIHPGGAQFVFCDGSTRFIQETVAYGTVFVYLNRIQDGKPLAEF